MGYIAQWSYSLYLSSKLVMHSPYLRHFRDNGGCHTSAMSEAESLLSFCVQPVHITVSAHTHRHMVSSSCLFRCHCKHKCCQLYSKCTHCDCPSWLSSVSVILQAYLGAGCLYKNLIVALNYSVQKHTK